MLFRCRENKLPLEDLLKLAGDVGGVAVHDGRVAVLDRARVVEDDDLGPIKGRVRGL